ncbi:MAG: hypothetical protein QXE05_06135, partial [Nitrososphaeria archaeon]
KLRGENVEEAIKYFDSLPIEKRLEIINYDNKMNAMLREKTAEQEKVMHMEALKKLTPELNTIDVELKKIRDAVKNFESKMNDFITHKTALQNLGVSSNEIAKEVPGSVLYLNITPSQLRRFTNENILKLPLTPEQIEEEIVTKTPESGIIDPHTGKIYRNYKDYATRNNIYVGSGSAHELTLKQRCDLIPYTRENDRLVKDCLSDPDCIKYLKEQEDLVRERAKLERKERWYLSCDSERVEKLLDDYMMAKKIKELTLATGTIEPSKQA